MYSTYFMDLTAKCCFPVNLRYKSENLNKIWKFKNPRWRPPVTFFIWLLLQWKPIRYHGVTLNWKYRWSLLYVPNFKSIGWIVSKVEGGGVWLTPNLEASCNYFFFPASRIKRIYKATVFFYLQYHKYIGLSCNRSQWEIFVQQWGQIDWWSKLAKDFRELGSVVRRVDKGTRQ